MDDGLVAAFAVPLRNFELDVSVPLEQGRTLALVGLSGAGKTTILRALAGLVRPASGRITYDDAVWFDAARRIYVPAEQRRIGVVSQDAALFPHLDAAANVAFSLGGRGLRRSDRRLRASELLDRLGVGYAAGTKPGALSGGERQRVGIARALARDPMLLLLDEPLSSLDPTTRTQVASELARLLPELGVTTVIVTHDYGDAMSLADEVAVVERGRIVQRGRPGQLLAEPDSAFVAEFAGINFLRGASRREDDGLVHVALEGGGGILVASNLVGAVGVVVAPGSIAIGAGDAGSARNALDGVITRLGRLGDRVRVTVATPAAVTAEVTAAAADELALAVGGRAHLTFKATACRLVPLPRSAR